MHNIELPDPLYGSLLRTMVDNPAPKRQCYAEGLVYEKSSLMIASDPGLGKSSITLQACMQMSAGMPVFGCLEVPEPIKVFYMQRERPVEEILERIQLMQEHVDWSPDRLIIDDSSKRLRLTIDEHIEVLCERINKHFPKVAVVDPIYANHPGLSKDEVANKFCDGLTALQDRTGVSIWLNHHTTKQTYDVKGKAIEKDDPFYGAQWIKAYVTGSYYMKKTEDGCELLLKKSSHANLLDHINLKYDHGDHISRMDLESQDAVSQLKLYFKGVKRLNKSVTFKQIKQNVRVSHSYLRKLLGDTPFLNNLKKVKSTGSSTLYEVTGDF